MNDNILYKLIDMKTREIIKDGIEFSRIGEVVSNIAAENNVRFGISIQSGYIAVYKVGNDPILGLQESDERRP